MSLNVFAKSDWMQFQFKEIAENISIRIEPYEAECDIYIGLEHLDTDSLTIRRYGEPKDVKGTKLKVQKGDIIFGKRRAYQRKLAVADFNGICSAHAMVLQAKSQNILPDFLPYLMQSDTFMDRAVQISEGSLSPTIKWKTLAVQKFSFPTKQKQERIIDILHKLEKAIKQSEQQEIALRDYRIGIIHQVFNTNESFGSLILNKDKIRISLGEAVDNLNISEKKPLEKGLSRFIGLEHIESENIKIENWGEISNGTTFTKSFKKGHVLFGKRRAYLKKAAIADFDGICSGDILVFEAKNDKLLTELLPYIIQNDDFFDFAVTTSAGSLSPRTKWKDLSNFQLYLPDKNFQQKLVAFFKKFDSAIEQTKLHREKLIAFKKGLLNEIVA